MEDLGKAVNRLSGRPKPLVSTGIPRPNEILDMYADISRAAELLDWSPQLTLEEGLAEMIAR